MANQPSVNPLFAQATEANNTVFDGAAASIQEKLGRAYQEEPNAKEELRETELNPHRSKHQDFLHSLSLSGKSLSEIQAAWHAYYLHLPDDEKHEVWREFYRQQRDSGPARPVGVKRPYVTHTEVRPVPDEAFSSHPKRLRDSRNLPEVRESLRHKLANRRNIKLHSSLHSLLFGAAMGTLVLAVLLFGLFNERVIAPFIMPARAVSATPIIYDQSAPVGPDPKIIIPKINVEIPVVYDEKSIAEKDFQKALDRGAVHYATTSLPGETGNTAIFGHSSNNILNSGKYKFAFVLLNRLEVGDTFMLTRNSKMYVYKVYDKKVVRPDEFWILDSQAGRRATATLVTCDPPGTTLNRLAVFAEQISPDPAGNIASTATQITPPEDHLPGDAPSLWSRITSWFD